MAENEKIVNKTHPLTKIFEHKAEGTIQREIVNELLNSDTRLDEKTELSKPSLWACLDTIEQYISDKGMEYSSKILAYFIKKCKKLLISKNRQSRKEHIETLRALANMENEIEQKRKESKVL